MLLNQLTDKQLKILFQQLTFTSFEGNKVPAGCTLQKGPVFELKLKPGGNYKGVRDATKKYVEEIKVLLEKNNITSYVVSPCFLMQADGTESFMLQVVVEASSIEVHSTLPNNLPSPMQPPQKGPGKLII